LWDDIYQTIGRKARDGIGDRAARDAQKITNLRLSDDLARPIGQRQNGLLQALVNPIAQRPLEPVKRQESRRSIQLL
jgi:hypothetical protein